MLPLLSLILLAFAVSLDGFGVGVMYGLRKIQMPLASVAIIALFSGVVILASMQIGLWVSAFFSPSTAKEIGAVILIGIGLWAIYQMSAQKKNEAAREASGSPGSEQASLLSAADAAVQGQPENAASKVLSIELRRLGIVIQILRTPSIADVDKSGIISPSEAALLGLALSLDAFGAGIGAALIGLNPYITAGLIALSSGSFIAFGLRIGYRFAEMPWMRRLSVVPGCLLILMGMMKLM